MLLTKSQLMVAIISAMVLIVVCTLSVFWGPSQRPYKEVHVSGGSSQKDEKKVPSLPSVDGGPSQRDDKEVPSLPSGPSQRDDKEVPSVNGGPSQRDDKEVPSVNGGPSQRDEKEDPSLPEYEIMPLVKYIKKREELHHTEWVSLLYNFLQTVDRSVSPHVNMVFADSNHTHFLDNWITAAVIRLKPPLHNLMVLSLDYPLCNQLLSRNISHTCIPVPPQSLVVAYPKGRDATWSSAMMIRQIVLRLINYWGYDVASYDSDAVLLHNPQVLYDAQPNVDVFSASTKNFPRSMCDKWGFNLSGGILMLRASPAVEALWSNISALVIDKDWDDQIALNVAVENMGVTWNKTTKVKDQCSVKSGWRSQSVINIFVFPQYQICRHCCKPSLSYETLYIAHPVGGHVPKDNKENALKKMKAWFL